MVSVSCHISHIFFKEVIQLSLESFCYCPRGMEGSTRTPETYHCALAITKHFYMNLHMCFCKTDGYTRDICIVWFDTGCCQPHPSMYCIVIVWNRGFVAVQVIQPRSTNIAVEPIMTGHISTIKLNKTTYLGGIPQFYSVSGCLSRTNLSSLPTN